MLRTINNYKNLNSCISEKNKTTKKIEEQLLDVLNKKNIVFISMEEYLEGKTTEEQFQFLGCMKNFSIIKKTYQRNNGRIVTFFSKL